MSSPSLRGVARSYLLSIAFWGGMSLLMGLQSQPLDYIKFWPSFLDLLVPGGSSRFCLGLVDAADFLSGRQVSRALPADRLQYVLLWSLGAAPFVLSTYRHAAGADSPYDDSLRKVFSAFCPCVD